VTDFGFEILTVEQFRQYMQQRREKDYRLVDVRQPEEYSRGHIPGAQLLPLAQLDADVSQLPSDQELVFYCHSGARSQAAAVIAADSNLPLKKIYSLSGGMMAWDGKQLTQFPRLQVFEDSETIAELMFKCMDLEKAALRFYLYVTEKYRGQPFIRTIEHLVKAEEAHARQIYGFWKEEVDSPRPFEELFKQLSGEVLEGGKAFDAAVAAVEKINGRYCLNLLELALNIEYHAFDMYRTLANRMENDVARQAFLAIAQGEKGHMGVISRAIGQCPIPD